MRFVGGGSNMCREGNPPSLSSPAVAPRSLLSPAAVAGANELRVVHVVHLAQLLLVDTVLPAGRRIPRAVRLAALATAAVGARRGPLPAPTRPAARTARAGGPARSVRAEVLLNHLVLVEDLALLVDDLAQLLVLGGLAEEDGVLAHGELEVLVFHLLAARELRHARRLEGHALDELGQDLVEDADRLGQGLARVAVRDQELGHCGGGGVLVSTRDKEVVESRGNPVRSWWLKFAFPTFLPARALGSIFAKTLEGYNGSWQDAPGNESQSGRGTRQERAEQSVACRGLVAKPGVETRQCGRGSVKVGCAVVEM